jgi:Family of unknown function (DUF6518)
MKPVTRPAVRRIADVLAFAIVFGFTLSVLKGNDAGVRDSIGNISAPWLLLPFVAAAVAGGRRMGQGALVGTLALLAALAAFYVANTFVLDLGSHPWLIDLRLTVQGGRQFFALAILGGPVFGALGSWWRRRGSTAVGVAVAALLVFEPPAWLLYGRSQRINYDDHPTVWVAEVVVGIGVCALAATVARPSRLGGPTAGALLTEGGRPDPR